MSPGFLGVLSRPLVVMGEAVYAYLSAWPFFLLHVGLAIFLARKLWSWKEAGTDKHVDSVAEEESLRPYIGFFILIGIAGTFFGFFQFAINAKRMADSGAVDLAKISTHLWDACANALPVGLFGILWTVVFHVWADRVCRTGPSNIVRGTQAGELSEPPEYYLRSIWNRLDHWGEKTETLWERVDSRAARIDFWLEKADKRTENAPASGGVGHDDVGRLEAAVMALTVAVQTRGAANKKYSDTMASAATTAAEAVKSCADAVNGLRGEIGQIGENIAESLKKSDALAEQLQMVNDVRKGVQDAAAGLQELTGKLEDLVSGVKESATAVTSSAQVVSTLAGATVEEMKKAARDVADKADVIATGVFDPLRLKLETVIGDMKTLGTEEVKALRELMSMVESITESFRRESTNAFTGMAEKVREATEPSLSALVGSVDGLRDEVDGAATRIKEGESLWLEPLNTMAQRIETFGAQSAELNRRLSDLAKGIDGLIARTSGGDGIQVHAPKVVEALGKVSLKLVDVERAAKLPPWMKWRRPK